MLGFFALAARSRSRQLVFRRVIVAHLLVLAAGWIALAVRGPHRSAELLGHLALVAGIVEGAVLVGWRLTQMPKSQALEFVLVTPLRPRRIFVAEALVGLGQLVFVVLSGLPVLALLVADGLLQPADPLPLLCVPLAWGTVAGLGLTVWAYEPAWLRRVGEKVMIALIVVYLLVGVLAGEHLGSWLAVLPSDIASLLMRSFWRLHSGNPFGVMRGWFGTAAPDAAEAMVMITLIGAGLAALLLWRGACRLQPHFHEFHYWPRIGPQRARRDAIGDWPLTWWAVKRVAQFSGRVNLWLAGGFSLLYALYLIAGDAWPVWLGRAVFMMVDDAGGLPALTTGLVLLAAVPAAFQYGLWDSSLQDRRRRLELLLLTDLGPADYWHAAASAAWNRGRGYFAIASMLWLAGAVAGRIAPAQALAAAAGGVLLWGLYFTLGFRAFSRGLHANGLGMLLTVGLPLLVLAADRLGWNAVASALPPGVIYSAAADSVGLAAVVGTVMAAGVALVTARRTLRNGDADLRRWYDRHAYVA